MAEVSVVKTPTVGPPPTIESLDTDILNINTKNPSKARGCSIYNVDYNDNPEKNRFVSPTFLLRRVTIGLVESAEEYKKDDSPNYFITVRQTGNDGGDTDALFEKIKAAESLMNEQSEFKETRLSSNIKAKEGKEPCIFFKLKYAKKPVKDPNNPKKPKRVIDKTRLTTKFYKAKKIDGKPVLVPMEFSPENIRDHVMTNSVMEAHITFDYGWKLNGQHGLSIHLDKAILLPPKNIVRANDMELTVPDYMVESDSEDETTPHQENTEESEDDDLVSESTKKTEAPPEKPTKTKSSKTSKTSKSRRKKK